MRFIPSVEALRLAQDKVAKRNKPNRSQRRVSLSRWINPIGLKRWYTDDSGEDILTAYAIKEKKRRRAADKVARESRRLNAQGHRRHSGKKRRST